MRKILKIVLPLIIILGTIVLVIVLMKTKAANPAVQISERIWQVDVIKVKSGSYAPTVTLFGQVEAPRLFNASAPLLSRVVAINIREGEQFKKGQLLAQLDERDFLPQVQIAEAKLAEIKAQISTEKLKYQSDKISLQYEEKLLELGRQALQRSLKIQQQKLASQSEADDAQKLVEQQRLSLNARKLSLDGHQARMAQLKATRKQLQAELQKAQLALERARFYAPYDGIAAKVNVAQGDQLTTGGQLFSIYPYQGLEIRAKIPASLKSEIAKDITRGHLLDAYIVVENQKIALNLQRLSGQASSSGIDALFSVSEYSDRLRLGAIYEIQLTRSAQDNLFVIPYKAIYGIDKIYKVKLDDNQDARMQALKVAKVGSYQRAEGQSETSQLLIRSSALNDGDQVIITHLPNALNGLKINPITESSTETDQQK